MMVSGGKKSPPSEIVAMCKAGGVHGQLNFGDSKADAAGWDSIQQGEIQGREREREGDLALVAAAAKVATTLAATAFG